MPSRTAIALATLILISIPLTAATINFDFTSSLVSLRPGQTAVLSGTMMNTGLSPAYLNGDAVNVAAPLTVDDLPFFLSAPPVLQAAASASGPILNVSVPATAQIGLY